MEKATIYDVWRMCSHYGEVCSSCPLCDKDCEVEVAVPIEEMDEINEIILKWCKEHPVETRQDKFLEMFPNARMKFGCLNVCPEDIDTSYECLIDSNLCVDCKKSYWLAEVEEL